jgi:hypothetical protein
MLKPNEDIMTETEGGKISLKSIGKSISKGAKKVGKVAKSVGKALTSDKAIKTYKAIGKEVLPIAKGVADQGLQMGATALADYMGQPELAPVFASVGQMGLDKGYSALGKEVGLDKNTKVPTIRSADDLTQASINLAGDNVRRRVLQRPNNQRPEMEMGRGLRNAHSAEAMNVAVRKTRKGLRIGGASAYRSPAYNQGLEYIMSGGAMITGMRSAGYDMRGITPSFPPSSIIQLGSPYERMNSPAMSPFIASSIQLTNKPISGGSFEPAGSRGGSFAVAGGSFYPA